MTSQAASATYSLITYTNAYSTVLTRSKDPLLEQHREVRLRDVLHDIVERTLRAYITARNAARREAGLRRAAREAAAVEREASALASRYPTMAQELRCIAAHRLGQFD